MKITISGSDAENLQKVEELAKDLGLTVEKADEIRATGSSKDLLQLMQNKASNGGIFSIQDPVAWQKAVREDRPLYGRE